MKTSRTEMTYLIAKAAAESGIGKEERYEAGLIAFENGICEMELETEWNRVTCYADAASGEILGIMSEAKTIEEILWRPEAGRAA